MPCTSLRRLSRPPPSEPACSSVDSQLYATHQQTASSLHAERWNDTDSKPPGAWQLTCRQTAHLQVDSSPAGWQHTCRLTDHLEPDSSPAGKIITILHALAVPMCLTAENAFYFGETISILTKYLASLPSWLNQNYLHLIFLSLVRLSIKLMQLVTVKRNTRWTKNFTTRYLKNMVTVK